MNNRKERTAPLMDDYCVVLGCENSDDVVENALAVGDAGFVWACDDDAAAIDNAREAVEQATVDNVRFVHGSMEKLSIPSNAAQVLICPGGLNQSPNADAIWQEVFRVLRAAGRLVITDVIDAAPHQQKSYMERMEKRGFSNVEVVDDGDSLLEGSPGRRKITVVGWKPGIGCVGCC